MNNKKRTAVTSNEFKIKQNRTWISTSTCMSKQTKTWIIILTKTSTDKIEMLNNILDRNLMFAWWQKIIHETKSCEESRTK